MLCLEAHVGAWAQKWVCLLLLAMLAHLNAHSNLKKIGLLHVDACVCSSAAVTSHPPSSQPCVSAADPHSVPLLQPSCVAMTQLHSVVLGSLVGLAISPGLGGTAGSGSSSSSSRACGDALSSARTLLWYKAVVHNVILTSGFMWLEWRLKANFVRQRLQKQLVFGPFSAAHTDSQQDGDASDTEGSKGVLYKMVTWLLATVLTLALLWTLCLWLVPQLPQQHCKAFGGACEEPPRPLSTLCGEHSVLRISLGALQCTARGMWDLCDASLSFCTATVQHTLIHLFHTQDCTSPVGAGIILPLTCFLLYSVFALSPPSLLLLCTDESWCADGGWWTALLMYTDMLWTCFAHVGVLSLV